MACNNCMSKDDKEQNKESNQIQYSQDIFSAFAERTIKRLWVVIILLVVLLCGTNGLWIWHNSQYEKFEYSYEQDGYGTNIIGDDNAVDNGTAAGE